MFSYYCAALVCSLPVFVYVDMSVLTCVVRVLVYCVLHWDTCPQRIMKSETRSNMYIRQKLAQEGLRFWIDAKYLSANWLSGDKLIN